MRCLRGRRGFEHRRAARRAVNRPRAALAVGELNNVTDAHYGLAWPLRFLLGLPLLILGILRMALRCHGQVSRGSDLGYTLHLRCPLGSCLLRCAGWMNWRAVRPARIIAGCLPAAGACRTRTTPSKQRSLGHRPQKWRGRRTCFGAQRQLARDAGHQTAHRARVHLRRATTTGGAAPAVHGGHRALTPRRAAPRGDWLVRPA